MAVVMYFGAGSKTRPSKACRGHLDFVFRDFRCYLVSRFFQCFGFRDFRCDLISTFFHFLEAENAVGNSENTQFSYYHDGVP